MEFMVILGMAVIVAAMITWYELKVRQDDEPVAVAAGGAASSGELELESSDSAAGNMLWEDALSDASDIMANLDGKSARKAAPKAKRKTKPKAVAAKKKSVAKKKKPAKKKAAKKKAPAKKKATKKKSAAKKPAAKKKSPTKKKAAKKAAPKKKAKAKAKKKK